MKRIGIILSIFLVLCLCGCSQAPEASLPTFCVPASTTPTSTVAPTVPIVPETQEALVLQQAPPVVQTHATVEPSGVLIQEGSGIVIDYSNTEQGYIMVLCREENTPRLKVRLQGPSATYTYNLTPTEWTAFPLSDENGHYQVTVYRNVEGSKYAAVLSLQLDVTLEDPFAPFLRSNQYVNFDGAVKTVTQAALLTTDITDPLEKVAVIYDYVVTTLTYDQELAATVKSGYLPDLDAVLEKQSGICFDYAALMTGMLRSQGIPAKLVVGYAGSVYHAWISVWTESTGWVDGVIFFDGAAWQRMDPTFASSSHRSPEIMEFIGNNTNYSAKYFY